jgi:hypothetical protein
MSLSHNIQLLVVVNGTETHIVANVNAPMRTVAEHALEQTEHRGRPLSDWELKDNNGRTLDLSRKVGEFRFGSNVILYLTLCVGVNGDSRLRVKHTRRVL